MGSRIGCSGEMAIQLTHEATSRGMGYSYSDTWFTDCPSRQSGAIGYGDRRRRVYGDSGGSTGGEVIVSETVPEGAP